MRQASVTKAAAVVLMGLLASAAWAGNPPAVSWMRQIGTTGHDFSHGVAVDGAGNAFISGYTSGSLGGPNSGSQDAFLTKYDAAGTVQWSRQLGTADAEVVVGVAVDGAGNAFVSGSTGGSLAGPASGGADAFLAKYNAAGTLQWSRQLGTAGADSAGAVAVDRSGNAFLSGILAGDAMLTKYDAAGTLLWSREVGTANVRQSNSMALDGAGNIFIGGRTDGASFLKKCDAEGTVQWVREFVQFGLDDYLGNLSVAADGAGNVFVSGAAFVGPNMKNYDAFLTKYDAAGTLLWSRQIGTDDYDRSTAVAVDGAGNAFITGHTRGSLGGPNSGVYSDDVFLTKYDADGTLIWSNQIGTPGVDFGLGVAVDGSGNVLITGNTNGSLGGPSSGVNDAFLVKFDGGGTPVPEPSAACVLAAIGLLALRRRR